MHKMYAVSTAQSQIHNMNTECTDDRIVPEAQDNALSTEHDRLQ